MNRPQSPLDAENAYLNEENNQVLLKMQHFPVPKNQINIEKKVKLQVFVKLPRPTEYNKIQIMNDKKLLKFLLWPGDAILTEAYCIIL